jgi:5-methylcytosine-specific restriction endonuclease McrA
MNLYSVPNGIISSNVLYKSVPAMRQTSGNMVNPDRRIGMFILTPKRICKTCGEEKPLSEYYADKKKSGGRQSSCKECIKQKKKIRYYNDPEKYRALTKAWSELNPGRMSANARQWYQDHPDTVKSRVKKWKAENKNTVAGYRRQYSEKHPDRILDKLHRRIAKKHNVEGGHFTEREWKALLDKYGHKCLCCGRSDVPLERDHVIPIGPPHSDEIANIQPLCRSCNARKGKREIDYR